MTMAKTKSFMLTATIVLLFINARATQFGDACRLFGDARQCKLKIESRLNNGEVNEAINEWNAMIKKLNDNQHFANILIKNNFDLDEVLDVFLARWETNKISGTDITIHDALFNPSLIDDRRKMFFIRYQIPFELIDVYYSKDLLDENNPRHLILPFLPWELNVDGSPSDNTVTYLGGGFIGRDCQADGRRTEIALHIWRNRDKYLEYFDNVLTARWYFDELFMRMDNPALYLESLKLQEVLLKRYMKENGKISQQDLCNLFPGTSRTFDSYRCFLAKILRVIDGDTIVVTPYNGGSDVVVRLEKIDAPEKGQPFGEEAKRYLSSWTGVRVKIYFSQLDKYDRILGSVIDMTNKVYLNLRLVSDGFAWHYTEYDSSPEFAEAERSARRYRLNLWSSPYAIKPSEWRRKNVHTDLDEVNAYDF